MIWIDFPFVIFYLINWFLFYVYSLLRFIYSVATQFNFIEVSFTISPQRQIYLSYAFAFRLLANYQLLYFVPKVWETYASDKTLPSPFRD